MTIARFLLILSGVLLNAMAQLFLKAGTNAIGDVSLASGGPLRVVLKVLLNINIIGGLGCYVLSVAIWIVALSKVDVSVAYPMLSIGYVVNAFAAWYLFGEVLSVTKLVGIGVIVLGVCLVARG